MDSVTWRRPAFVLVVFVIGAAIGFGIGFNIGNGGTKSNAKAPKVTPSTPRQRQAQAAAQQRRTRFISCMAIHGVKWPATKGGANYGKPPPGVSPVQYSDAAVACYGASANQTPAQLQRQNEFVSCMARHGVKWPATKGGPNYGKAPPGVSPVQYSDAAVACYRERLQGVTTTTGS